MFDFSLGNFAAVQVGRISSSNLHGNVLAQFVVSAFQFYQDTDLAAAMDIAVHFAFSAFIADEAANGNVFADLGNRFRYGVFHGLAVHVRCQESIHISRIYGDNLLCNGVS